MIVDLISLYNLLSVSLRVLFFKNNISIVQKAADVKKITATPVPLITAWLLAQLAQLVDCQTAVWEVEVQAPDGANTKGLKITEENVLPF